MKKKTGLSDLDVMLSATQAKNAGGAAAKPEPESEDYAVSAINLRKSDWKLLRRVADARVENNDGKGRRSVSAVLQRLIEDNREALESEIFNG